MKYPFKFAYVLFILIFWCHDVTHAMLSKNKRPYDPNELQPHARYRRNIQDLYADNALSSSRLQELLDDAHDAGIEGLRDVRSNASSKHAKANAHKKLRRKFAKGSQWPKLYWARIRTYSAKSHGERYQWVAFMLPHEYLEVLHRLSDGHAMYDKSGLDPKSLEHFGSLRNTGANEIGRSWASGRWSPMQLGHIGVMREL